MRGSLFIKIYATVLASLVVVALVSAVFVRLGQDEQDMGWLERRDRFVAAMLPAEADPQAQQVVLDRLADAIDGDIAVFAPDGTLLASAGGPPPPGDKPEEGRRRRDRHGIDFALHLADGRVVTVSSSIEFGPGRRSPLLYLLLIAGGIGVAAYPIVRHLTRRLERLRHGVETWGGGTLSIRVDDRGSDEIAAVAQTFNMAADRIEKMLDANRSLLANASHELRSPLARLRMAVDMGGDTPSADLRAEAVRNLGEIDALVEEILLASRLDHIETLERREAVDLLALTAEEGARQGVAVEGSASTVEGDPKLLVRLVRNLMQNALRHGRPPVVARVDQHGDAVRLAVLDQGDGISDGESERVFEPFYRPSGRAESAGGWGLGLSLVRQIAAHHGAVVSYERPAGGGSCFTVDFPASAAGRAA
jgi:signal transduction histidine kinase